MSDDAHGHDGHDHAAHGPDPLPGVDPAPLHALVDEIAAALHGYMDTATGVRAEFGSHEADEDPRILAIEAQVGTLNARLYDTLHERLGLHADLTGLTWDDGEEGTDDDAPGTEHVDTFHLGFVIGPQAGTSDLSMDSVLGMVDSGGAEIAHQLMDAGFEVVEWGASRGAPVLFEGDDGDEEEPA